MADVCVVGVRQIQKILVYNRKETCYTVNTEREEKEMSEFKTEVHVVMEKGRPVSKVTYVLLALFLGGFGIHNFYAGKTGLGILYLLFCWTLIPAFAALVQAIVALCKTSDELGRIYV